MRTGRAEAFAPTASPQARRWLRRETQRDWASLGLEPFKRWAPAQVGALRIIAHAPSPMALIIGQPDLLIANPALQARLLPAIGEDVNGRPLAEILPELGPSIAAVLGRVFAGRSLRLSRQALTRREGRTADPCWFDLSLSPVFDENGEVAAALCTASDVTPYMRRVQRLTDSEQRLRTALEGSGMVGVWTLDVAANISVADENVARMYGLSPSECASGVGDDRFIRAIHPEDRARVEATLSEAIAKAEPYRCRYRVQSATGRHRWVVTQAKPSLGEDGAVSRMLGVVVDVTDQMETASALAESRFQYEALTEALPQIVWSSAPDGRHDYFSKRWSEFTGVAPEEINEETWKQLVYPDHWPMVSEAWERARRTGEPYDIDYRFRHRTGEYRWLRVMALPIRDKGGKIVRWCGTSTDVHEAYLVTEERERLARELERIATEDQLTRVLTRRAFMAHATAALEDEGLETAGLLMLDVDHFKSINDGYGHPGGDQVLAAVASRVMASIKRGDLVGRLGGEEFAVFLPGCTERDVQDVAERIRCTISESLISVDDASRVAVSVSVSVGAIVSHRPHQTLDRLLAAADGLLYQAKSAGRDRVVMSQLIAA